LKQNTIGGLLLSSLPLMVRLGVVTGRAVHAELWSEVLAAHEGIRFVASVTDLDDLDVEGDRLNVVLLDLDSAQEAAKASRAIAAAWPEVAPVVAERGMQLAAVIERVRSADPSMTVLSSSALTTARGQLRTTARRSPVAAYPRLTERECEVLESLSRGNSTPAIAAELRMSVHTCRGHLRTLMAKLGARTQVEVVAFVAEHGLPER
jgi:DNA-binding CsgD family transcriptional regulator